MREKTNQNKTLPGTYTVDSRTKRREKEWNDNRIRRQVKGEPKVRKRKKKRMNTFEYEPNWASTEICNQGLGLDAIVNIHLLFRTGWDARQLFTPHGNYLLCAMVVGSWKTRISKVVAKRAESWRGWVKSGEDHIYTKRAKARSRYTA